jgi:phosphoenolpyruvate carboxykinase (GTP)
MGTKAAQPNSRFTVSLYNCPTLSKDFDNPYGVPISAIILGGRRSRLIPLVTEAFNWDHGVFFGARMGSETTAAAAGKVGVLRRDPFAMLPFCGYNMGDYFRHWINMGKLISRPPKIFSMNAFRVDENGKFIWPGFGDNIRILKWVLDRVHSRVGARETPIGLVPKVEDIDTYGLDVPAENLKKLFEFKPDEWGPELEDIKKFLDGFGRHIPYEIRQNYEDLASRIRRA